MLFTFAGGWGHAEPLVPVAREALAAGHDVLFAGQRAMVRQVEAAGFAAAAVGPPTVQTDKLPLLAPDPVNEDRAMREFFAGRLARERATELAALIASWTPDVLVHDEVDFGAMVAAERLGVPHVGVVVIASGTFLRPDVVSAPLGRLRAEHGLPPDPSVAMLQRDLLLVPVPPGFRDPGSPLPPTAHALRPGVLEARSGVREARSGVREPAERSGIYVTLGTIFNLESGDLFDRVLSGVRDLRIPVTITIGPHLDPAGFGPQPNHVRLAPFIPQAQVLAEVDAVVCHGGSGTVIGALANGLPLVILAMGADQPDNARRVEALGVGIALDVMAATPADIATAVRTVRNDPAYRRNAQVLRAEAAALPDAAHGLRLVESLARRE